MQLTRAHLARDRDARLAAIAESFQNGPAQSVTSVEELAPTARAWLAALPQPADQVVVVRTEVGELLSTRSTLDLSALPDSNELISSDESRWWTLPVAGPDVSALTVPLTLAGAPAGTLVAAASERDIDERVSALLRWVLVAIAVGFAFAVALAIITVRRSLRPLGRMATQVDAIQEAGDLARRVEHDGPADEVGRLATAFNRTLGRLESSFASQRQFLADASHELRTPLTVARGQLDLIADTTRTPDEADHSRWRSTSSTAWAASWRTSCYWRDSTKGFRWRMSRSTSTLWSEKHSSAYSRQRTGRVCRC